MCPDRRSIKHLCNFIWSWTYQRALSVQRMITELDMTPLQCLCCSAWMRQRQRHHESI